MVLFKKRIEKIKRERRLPVFRKPQVPYVASRERHGPVIFDQFKTLRSALDELSPIYVKNDTLTMEQAGQQYGFTAYRTIIKSGVTTLTVPQHAIVDRGQLFVDDKFLGEINYLSNKSFQTRCDSVSSNLASGHCQVTLLVESHGRLMKVWDDKNRKGLRMPLLLNDIPLRQLDAFSVGPNASHYNEILASQSGLIPTDHFGSESLQHCNRTLQPILLRGFLNIDFQSPADTFLLVPEFLSRGNVTINSEWTFGKYDTRAGPQKFLIKEFINTFNDISLHSIQK